MAYRFDSQSTNQSLSHSSFDLLYIHVQVYMVKIGPWGGAEV